MGSRRVELSSPDHVCQLQLPTLSQYHVRSFSYVRHVNPSFMLVHHANPSFLTMVSRSMSSTSSKESDTVVKMHEFLQTFYASQEHGILSVESACKKFCQMYRCLTITEKTTFLCYLAENYGVNQDSIVQVAQQVLASQERGEAIMLRVEERMRGALIAKYQLLFSQIGRIENGVKFLVDMRADVLTILTNTNSDIQKAYLQSLTNSLRELLSLWFTVGFLSLERITWQSPCDIVQKVSDYEAVHPIRNWADLKRRVGSYRRCFVFTHSSMPREPVVVLHTALTSEISSSIHSIIGSYSYTQSSTSSSLVNSPVPGSPLDFGATEEVPEDPAKITTAMFYSITSTQKGLQGVDLGNYLIKKVVGELQQEFVHMTQFSSMSPIPGFRDWLLGEINLKQHRKNICEEDDDALTILKEIDILNLQMFTESTADTPLETFKKLVNSHAWTNNEQIARIMEAPLMRLCARYLYKEKRRGYALNPVANFHLQNGAVLWRLNWQADNSLRGLMKSCGIMVNYRYYLEDTEINSQQYIEHQNIATTDEIRELCT